MDTICINCPLGCTLHVEEINGFISVTGNTCKRGEIYGINEFKHPMRTLTTLVKMDNGEVASCKTSGDIPKEKIFELTNYIAKLVISSNVKVEDVIEKNVLNLGVDLIVTGKK